MSQPRPFLLCQRLSLLEPGHHPLAQLDIFAAQKRRDRGGFQEDKDSPWKPLARPDWLLRSGPTGDLRRAIVVADAGLGKTTNLKYFSAMLGGVQRTQLVFFLPIEELPDHPDQLFQTLLDRCWAGGRKMPRPQAERLFKTLRDSSQISLVLDSLDQALSRPKTVETLKLILSQPEWRTCPIVISTRPHALTSEWDKFFKPYAEQCRFIRIEELDEKEQRFLLGQIPDETDPEGKRRIDRFDLIPQTGRRLLGVPRVIELLRELGNSREDYAHLTTMTDVYWKCCNEMLREGLKADEARIRLEWDETDGLPGPEYRDTQVEIARHYLGALAFEMMNYTATRPNVAFVPATESNEFLKQVSQRLESARREHDRHSRYSDRDSLGESGIRRFLKNFRAIASLNSGPLENYFLDDAGRHRDLRWRNPTMQAYFAATWVAKHGTPADIELVRTWIHHWSDDRYGGYREFWHFVSELGGTQVWDKTATRRELWEEVVGQLYQSPMRPTEFIYRSWQAMRETSYQKDFLAEFPAIRNGDNGEEKKAIADRMMAGFIKVATPNSPLKHLGDTGSFWMGATKGLEDMPPGSYEAGDEPPVDDKAYDDESPPQKVKLEPFQTSRYAVRNVEYELFCEAHRDHRWANEYTSETHGLVEQHGLGADDDCPVVNVSWYDAWVFAVWCGCVLPTEEQWEYAARAGGKTPYNFRGTDGETINEKLCNYGGKFRYTVPVDNLSDNIWGLSQMLGNVWEWCLDKYNDNSYSVRGGSWLNDSRSCRVSRRGWAEPGDRSHDGGFRLACLDID